MPRKTVFALAVLELLPSLVSMIRASQYVVIARHHRQSCLLPLPRGSPRCRTVRAACETVERVRALGIPFHKFIVNPQNARARKLLALLTVNDVSVALMLLDNKLEQSLTCTSSVASVSNAAGNPVTPVAINTLSCEFCAD